MTCQAKSHTIKQSSSVFDSLKRIVSRHCNAKKRTKKEMTTRANE